MSLFSINKVYLLGNITKDVVVKQTKSGTSVANFSVATSQSVKVNDNWEDKTTFHNIVAWKSVATIAGKLEKGSKVTIEGRIQNRNYEKEDGTKVYITEIVAEKVIGLSDSRNNQQTSQVSAQDASDSLGAEPVNSKDISDDVPF
jgi:single-strand DNA-binding protein